MINRNLTTKRRHIVLPLVCVNTTCMDGALDNDERIDVGTIGYTAVKCVIKLDKFTKFYLCTGLGPVNPPKCFSRGLVESECEQLQIFPLIKLPSPFFLTSLMKLFLFLALFPLTPHRGTIAVF